MKRRIKNIIYLVINIRMAINIKNYKEIINENRFNYNKLINLSLTKIIILLFIVY